MRLPVAALLAVLAGGAAAQDDVPPDAPPEVVEVTPVVREIDFEGNDVTQPQVMLREMVIKVGDPADADLIERSRQGVQDLGLFKEVAVRTTPIADGVRLTFVVREKWYILPIPRFDANSEGERAYGASLRWYNVAGYNHTLRGNWTVRDEKKLNRGESTSFSMSYSMPFVLESPYGVSFGGGHSETPIEETTFGEYVETSDSFQISTSRAFGRGPASQGWSGGLTLGWTDVETEGLTAPDPQGQATALTVFSNFRDVRDRIFSDEGTTYGASIGGAKDGFGSDYTYVSVAGNYGRYTVFGKRQHQSFNYFARVASYHGGPTTFNTARGVFGLGGTSALRGYPSDFVVGDFLFHASTEYLRPIVADWLRFVIILEAGNAYEDARNMNGRIYSSVGVGLRVRFTFLVNFEMEVGVGFPDDGGGARFFASKV